MKRIFNLQVFTATLFLCSISAYANAGNRKPTFSPNREPVSLVQVLSDTIPVQEKAGGGAVIQPNTEKPQASIIKSVPKARRVLAPKPVQIKVKPVKVIKPKIIKPVLKVL